MASRPEPACLIAAGGTAGHVLPSLAVAEELVARGARVTFAGSPERLEARLVPEAGFEFDPFQVSGLPRRPGPRARPRARPEHRRRPRLQPHSRRPRPDVVLGGGGYVERPDGRWLRPGGAFRRRCSRQTRTSGWPTGSRRRSRSASSSRSRSRGARVGSTASRAGRSRALAPGGARRSAAPVRPAARRAAAARLRGQSGRAGLNELAVETFGDSGPAVLHLSGERDYAELRDRVSRPDYRLLPFIDDVGAALGAADLALARAGGSVWELAAAGVPAVLVPYPSATADHQT